MFRNIDILPKSRHFLGLKSVWSGLASSFHLRGKGTQNQSPSKTCLSQKIYQPRVGTSQDVPSSFRAGYIFESFAVLTSFRTIFQRPETGLNRSVLDFSSTLLWKPVSEQVFIYQKPVYTRKYSKMRWSEMAPEHPGMIRPLRGRPQVGKWEKISFCVT